MPHHLAEQAMRSVIAQNPIAYPSDLDVDFEELRRHQPGAFGWLVNEYGTHLLRPIWLSPKTFAGELVGLVLRDRPNTHCYLWDGRTLQPVTALVLEGRLRALAAPPPPRVARLRVRDGCAEYLRAVVRFAQAQDLIRQFVAQLRALREYGEGACECLLYRPFGLPPNSVGFTITRAQQRLLVGGLVFDAGQPGWIAHS